VVIGLTSSGVHSNGYSLVRRVIERACGSLDSAALQQNLDGRSLADAVMAPTRIYVKPVLALLAEMPVKGIAHITGGGLVENVPRVLPETCQAVLEQSAWQRPAIFDWLQREGAIDAAEMHRVFNCGIGLVLVVAPAQAQACIERLRALGETAQRIGTIGLRPAGAAPTLVV